MPTKKSRFSIFSSLFQREQEEILQKKNDGLTKELETLTEYNFIGLLHFSEKCSSFIDF